MELSSYQQAILKEWKETDKNLVIEAGPGSGKTFMLLQLAKNIPIAEKAIFLAFNKSIAEELSRKLPFNIKASTMHSLGLRTLMKSHGCSFKIDENKTFSLLRKRLEDFKFYGKHGEDYKKKCGYLYSLAKIYNIYRVNLGEIENLKEIAGDYDLPVMNDVDVENFTLLLNILNDYNSKLKQGSLIDFCDMLWLCKDLPDCDFNKYRIIFIDECQDLNRLQKMIVDRSLHPKGRFVSVGDSRQSIYAFCGANIQSFNEFKNAPNTETLPLSITYRCARSIVCKANSVFDGLEWFHEAEEGIVKQGSLDEVVPGDFILCRNNKPLVEAFIKLLSRNIPASIYGKDFEKKLIRFMEKLDCQSGKEMYDKIDVMRNELLADLREKGIYNPETHPSVGDFDEVADILKILVSEKGFNDTKDMIERMFSDSISEDKVTLMTCHKSKGLEADNVFFLNSNLIPSQYATSPIMLYGEKCLAYVAITRAKKKLVYCSI